MSAVSLPRKTQTKLCETLPKLEQRECKRWRTGTLTYYARNTLVEFFRSNNGKLEEQDTTLELISEAS